MRSYLYDAHQYGDSIELSVQTRAHISAAEEYMHLANRGKDTAENRLYALSHAVYAAEGALYEAAQVKLGIMGGRDDLRIGCNFFKYTSPNSRYAKFFKENGITPKGHPLWFGHSEVNPEWLKNLSYEELRTQAGEMAMHHVSAYAGRVNVCLPFAEYVAGRYNCYGSLPEHLCSPLAYLKKVCEKDIPFDVVGIQLYFPARDMVAVDKMLRVFAGLGKKIHITEMGVNGGLRNTEAGASGSAWSQLDMSEGTWHGGWNERTQADWLEMFYTIAASHEEIEALTWWDFIEPSFSGNGAFLYEDENPREIFFRLKEWKRKYIR